MMINKEFWQGKKVFITGHTGFKGSWLCLWLTLLGAKVTGYALQPPTKPSLFELCRVDELVTSVIGDVRDRESLTKVMLTAQPEIVIHMAAQALVRDSYNNPVDTYAINVMGTVHVLEAVRACRNVKAIVNVTTDKCYENKEWVWGYRENEPMGGYDPYSNSKGCSELVTSSYRSSFFNPNEYKEHGVGLATARAGNVIGGGDWAADRLIPDCINALLKNEKIRIRNPHSIRPWQHVLEPLSGYLLLAQRLYEDGKDFAEGWNFGPNDSDAKPVAWVVRKMCEEWGSYASYEVDKGNHPHEAHYLKLDCSKAKAKLFWQPSWDLEQALGKIVEWVHAYQQKADMRAICLQQIQEYMKS
ncbi:MAG: CDP-glucose 4,6-dehydratase [Pelosinus sp.]|jgi:CDP-glucose 4,6-dehydratase|nr:CDP-glucose 4,6-dehydratase [Pelosinus sp.]